MESEIHNFFFQAYLRFRFQWRLREGFRRAFLLPGVEHGGGQGTGYESDYKGQDFALGSSQRDVFVISLCKISAHGMILKDVREFA